MNTIINPDAQSYVGPQPQSVKESTMQTFAEFPKTLLHPAHKPARLISEAVPGSSYGAIPCDGTPGRPAVWEAAQWPPVIARDAQEEEKFRAKGYVTPGKSDPVAFSTANASPPSASYEHIEWPKWLTSPTGAQVLVKSVEEEDKQRQQLGMPARERKRAKAGTGPRGDARND
jgi:hypothetical protein